MHLILIIICQYYFLYTGLSSSDVEIQQAVCRGDERVYWYGPFFEYLCLVTFFRISVFRNFFG